MGRHDRGLTGLRCLLPLAGKRRRTAAEAGLGDIFPAAGSADEGADEILGAEFGVDGDFGVAELGA